MKVLCFGSLNIDYTYKVDHVIKKGETQSSDGMSTFAGGKGLNQSIALAKAGAEVYHAGAIGEEGQFLVDMMNEAGVNTKFIKKLKDVRSGHAIIQNDKGGDNCIILFGGANQAITKEQVDEVLANFEKGDYLVLQNEINMMPYIMEQAAKIGMFIVLNPSPMNEKILALPLEEVSLFMLNEIEGGQILGKELSEEFSGEKMAEALLERFPKASVLLTLGGAGSVYMDRELKVRQQAYRVKAVDTTAAGDTFTGFFISGLIAGLPVAEATDQASKASAIAVSRPGAAPSIPYLSEVKEFSL